MKNKKATDKRKKDKKIEKKRDVLHILLVTLIVLFLLYYLILGLFSGFGSANIFIWPFFTAFLLAFVLIRKAWKKGKIRIPKWIRIGFYSLLAVCFAFFGFVEICICSQFSSNAPENVDYIIVLGAGVRGETPSLILSARIDAAYNYLTDNPDTICIATGGQGSGEDISEADCIKKELISRGIDESRILTEDQSTDTSENLKYSQNLIADKNASVAIVSSNFHVFRGKALARRCGFEQIYGISAPIPPGLLPHYMVREFVSIVVDTLSGNTAF
ncbi:MAG: YdcF family protein [Eubacteriales bacterium]